MPRWHTKDALHHAQSVSDNLSTQRLFIYRPAVNKSEVDEEIRNEGLYVTYKKASIVDPNALGSEFLYERT
jgi:hypothetical protein